MKKKVPREKYGVMFEDDNIKTVCIEVTDKTEDNPLLMPLLSSFIVYGIGSRELCERLGIIYYSGQSVDAYIGSNRDRKSTRLNSSHTDISRMPSSA